MVRAYWDIVRLYWAVRLGGRAGLDYGHAGETVPHRQSDMTTFHTYPDLLTDGGRLAATEWPGATISEAVAATLRVDPEAIVLRAGQAIGLAPGGLG